MYLVTIINNDIETVINAVSTDINTPRISGTIKQGINCIDSFTFSILPNNPGYNLIYPYKTLVKVFNVKSRKYEFIGRVLTPSGSMDSSGLISKQYICESELAYLIDSSQIYGEYHNITIEKYLEIMLNRHNLNREDHKKIYLGNVTVKDSNDSIYKYLSYDSTWKNIEEDLLDTYGGELKLRYEDDKKYLDYLIEIGEKKETEIRLGKNIKDITNDIDPTNYITRLVPLGAKLQKYETGEDGTQTEVDSEERLTIESVNNGINYIDDPEAIEEFGIIEGFVTYDDVNDVNNLFRKGKEYLASQRIIVSNKVSALDLSIIGLDVDSFEVGNYYPLVHELLGINYYVRIIEKDISIENPQSSTITLGDKQKDIKQYQLDTKKRNKEVVKLAEEAKKKAIQVKNYTTEEIYRVDGRINGVMTETSNKFKEVDNEINNLKNSSVKYVSNEDEFKKALDLAGYIYITSSFSITEKLSIKSNTLIEMAPGTFIKMDEGSFFITESNENTTRYNGATNIIFNNCTFDGGSNPKKFRNMIALFHATNITFNNVTFKDIPGSHAIDINGSRNIKVLNCNFMGYTTNPEGAYREAIQLDVSSAYAMPYFDPNSKCYDYTVTRDVLIDNCWFGGSGSEGTCNVSNCIGQHSQIATSERMEGITISNCIMRGNNNLGSDGSSTKYGNAIRLMQCTNINIVNNHIINFARGIMLDILDFVRTNEKATTENNNGKYPVTTEYGTGCRYINISNNTINCGVGAKESGIFINVANGLTVSHNKHKNINIHSNNIFDIPLDSYGMYIEDVNNCSITNNQISSSNNSTAFKVNVDNCSNVNSNNNFISGSTAQQIYTSNNNGCGEGLVINVDGNRKLLK